MNLSVILGVIKREPDSPADTRGQDNGTILKMFVETDDSYIGKTGELIDKKTMHKVVAFGDLAARWRERLCQDQTVLVEGRLQNITWTDDDGVRKYRTEIVARSIKLI
jgi:single-strand DNA-binding protein